MIKIVIGFVIVLLLVMWLINVVLKSKNLSKVAERAIYVLFALLLTSGFVGTIVLLF